MVWVRAEPTSVTSTNSTFRFHPRSVVRERTTTTESSAEKLLENPGPAISTRPGVAMVDVNGITLNTDPVLITHRFT